MMRRFELKTKKMDQKSVAVLNFMVGRWNRLRFLITVFYIIALEMIQSAPGPGFMDSIKKSDFQPWTFLSSLCHSVSLNGNVTLVIRQ